MTREEKDELMPAGIYGEKPVLVYLCPSCREELDKFEQFGYCPECGQKLDWSVLDD